MEDANLSRGNQREDKGRPAEKKRRKMAAEQGWMEEKEEEIGEREGERGKGKDICH